LSAAVKEGHVGAGLDGVWLESDAFAASCHLVLWAVFSDRGKRKGVLEKDVGDE